MKKMIPVMLLAAAFMMLTGCNTIEGMGRDIKKGGEAISGAADKAKS